MVESYIQITGFEGKRKSFSLMHTNQTASRIFGRAKSLTPTTDFYNLLKADGVTSEEMAEIGRRGYLFQIREGFINEMKKREIIYDIEEVGEAYQQLCS